MFLSQETSEAPHLKTLEKSAGGSMLITICRWENRGFEFDVSLVLKIPMCLRNLHYKYFPSYTDLGSAILSLIA